MVLAARGHVDGSGAVGIHPHYSCGENDGATKRRDESNRAVPRYAGNDCAAADERATFASSPRGSL